MIQKFASKNELDRWTDSKEAEAWHGRLHAESTHVPEYRIFDGPELWFSATPLLAGQPPARWRMAIVTWIGIFPTVSVFIGLLAPHLSEIPYLPRMAILTIVIVATMHYIVMPNLLARMRWWLRRG